MTETGKSRGHVLMKWESDQAHHLHRFGRLKHKAKWRIVSVPQIENKLKIPFLPAEFELKEPGAYSTFQYPIRHALRYLDDVTRGGDPAGRATRPYPGLFSGCPFRTRHLN
jgi:hypothetical protein